MKYLGQSQMLPALQTFYGGGNILVTSGITLSEYLANPCGLSSVPFWKAQEVLLPENMLIVHGREFSYELLETYEDTPYFRIMHDLVNLQPVVIPYGVKIDTICKYDYAQLVDVISKSYLHIDIKVDRGQVESWTQTPVYAPGLWLAAYEHGKMVGAIIADLDLVAHEGIIEWLQVLPEHRNAGLGTALINFCLKRMQGNARFATVSGQVDNQTRPEDIYRRCGFTGEDVWHILRRKEELK